MAHAAVVEERQGHMGLPLSNGKLAIWLFLITEVMFFTALIGTYIILRNGTPSPAWEPWPKPHEVGLIEWVGAFNTFVLICSSLTVVLAHYALSHGNTRRAVQYIAVSLMLGCVFLGVKAMEYKMKFDHGVLPGRVPEKLEGQEGLRFVNRVQADLTEIAGSSAYSDGLRSAARSLLEQVKGGTLSPKQVNARVVGTEALPDGSKLLSPAYEVHDGWEGPGLLEKAEHEGAHLTHAIPYGNLWASCYFAMTGFHALHVLGGLVIFVIILLMALRGVFGQRHESMLELTGLYWHFVDIVWIFLFPLLYLI